MNRFITWVLAAFVAEMVAVAVGVAVWRWEAFTGFAALSEKTQRALILTSLGLAFCPAWFALGWWRIHRRMIAQEPRHTDDHRRFQQVSLLVAGLFAVGVQAWLAAGTILGAPPGREFGLRLLIALVGVFLAVVGNFQAKVGAPTGDGAPDPGVWTRAMLRHGWTAVLAGALIVIGAAFLPVRLMFIAMVAVVGLVVLSARLNVRDLLRAGRP